ncbi:LOW QUALITY PROTEIN: CD63 antigen-like [Uloborus diversus]|uniref:LOW QUALITY PROTEIN: CD63 antigen-like n=1 Tax=Uloborus diversus TaxID=327109 RepID=UPI0024093E67|nr:LOW QUALITY PROTEIN: CD63 antigen-like [Uloborus diversus]
MWVLATTPTVKSFFTGSLIFTYIILCVGSLLFINEILGWIGSYKRGTCLMKFYLVLSVLTISAEVGGIVALNVLSMKMTDVLSTAWSEVNQITKNVVQEHFECCGFLGPQEFADTTDPIDDSCYYTVMSDEDASVVQMRTLNRMGCKEKLVDWFYRNKLFGSPVWENWLLLQVTVVLFAVCVINQLDNHIGFLIAYIICTLSIITFAFL